MIHLSDESQKLSHYVTWLKHDVFTILFSLCFLIDFYLVVFNMSMSPPTSAAPTVSFHFAASLFLMTLSGVGCIPSMKWHAAR